MVIGKMISSEKQKKEAKKQIAELKKLKPMPESIKKQIEQRKNDI